MAPADCWNWGKSTNERGNFWVGSWGLSCRYKRFLFYLGCSIVGPVQNVFPHHTLFLFLCPHRSASWASSRAGSLVSYTSLHVLFSRVMDNVPPLQERQTINCDHHYRGRILWRNWDRVFLLAINGHFYILADSPPPPPPWAKLVWNWFVCKHCIRKPQVWELSRLCPETPTKLYVHKFGFSVYRNCHSVWG